MASHRRYALGLVVAAVRIANASPAASNEQPTADEPVTAPPGQESGRTDPVDDGDSTARQVGRAALFVPKLAFELAIAPLEAAMFANDRYISQYLHVRFTAEHEFSVLPTAQYQTDFGFAAGVAVRHKNLFGGGEHALVQATGGGRYHYGAAAHLDSGERLGPVVVGISGNFDRRATDPFFGIGNADLGPEPMIPIAPTASRGFETYHRYQEARAAATADLLVVPMLHATATAALTDLKYGESEDGIAIDQIYDASQLAGFTTGVRHLYTEGEVRWDTRDPLARREPIVGLHATGSLVRGFAGRVNRLDGGTDFWRYGLELQHAFHLAPGPRILAFRAYGEAVTGSRDEVPFTELPALGGDVLRGYPFRRFRDRVATVTTAQYEWDISRAADAFVFVDAGRVFDSIDDIGAEHVRFGFGAGLDLHSMSGYLLETGIASSSDGGLILTVTFNPVIEQRPRWR